MNKNLITSWTDEIHRTLLVKKPELIDTFQIYAEEAVFARELIDFNLSKIPKKTNILEVGAGLFILSCQLCREGYKVSCIEPTAKGFSHFNELQKIILKLAKAKGYCPEILKIRAEELNIKDKYDFAFSINVMEHVDDISSVISNVFMSLKSKAVYRFICPNYSFPYEPHFNIPILFSKRFTEFIFKTKIFNNPSIPDSIGTWISINWISTKIIKDIEKKNNFEVVFSQELLLKMLERANNDPFFSSRRPLWLKYVFYLLVKTNFHKLTKFIPTRFQPIIDCTIYYPGTKKNVTN